VLNYKRNYPVMVNWEDQTEFAAEARAVAGDCRRAAGDGRRGLRLHARRPGPAPTSSSATATGAPVHHPKYNFNDEAIPAGCSWWAEIVERRLPAA
jgi:metal-dependent amidase/aminoacylase/carboxypeptidase family protein